MCWVLLIPRMYENGICIGKVGERMGHIIESTEEGVGIILAWWRDSFMGLRTVMRKETQQ